MNSNLVSIITPSHNSSKFISDTIESVINQTYVDWEMIIVDDCSNDNSVNIIRRYVEIDKRIKLIELKQNVGAAEARNIAIRIASGKYIAFLDSDDLWLSFKLDRQIQFMNSNNYSFSYTAYGIINEEGKYTNKVITVPKFLTYKKYLKNTIIGCLTVIIDKEKIGYFEMPNIRSSHDMALWLFILKKGNIAFGLNEELSLYRIVSNSNTAKKKKAALDVWKVYRKIEKLNLIYSIYCFSFYAFNAIKKRIL